MSNEKSSFKVPDFRGASVITSRYLLLPLTKKIPFITVTSLVMIKENYFLTAQKGVNPRQIYIKLQLRSTSPTFEVLKKTNTRNKSQATGITTTSYLRHIFSMCRI